MDTGTNGQETFGAPPDTEDAPRGVASSEGDPVDRADGLRVRPGACPAQLHGPAFEEPGARFAELRGDMDARFPK